MRAKQLSDAEQLWRNCFDDSDDFVRFYFEHIARTEEIYLHYEEGEAVAHIHAPHYKLRDGVGQAYYISGACTQEAYRGRGIMHELMVRVMRAEYARGCVAALLIPASEPLRAYYAQHFGFVTNNYRYSSPTLHSLEERAEDKLSTAPAHRDNTSTTAQYLAEALEHYAESGIHHSPYQIANIEREYLRWGKILTATDSYGARCALALCREDEEHIYVDAALGSEPWRLRSLLPKDKELHLTLPHRPRSTTPYTATPRGMVRPLSIRAYAQRYAERGGADLCFAWADSIIPQNTGTYTIESGQLHYTPTLDQEPIGAEALVELLVGEYWMGLMHD